MSEQLSSVYGPVKSWRYGSSLGIDLLLQTSICSFNCVYCQLGNIQVRTLEQKIYVPTERVVQDLSRVDMKRVDIVAFSGSGEPTLALNLGEVIGHVKEVYRKPVMVLTNASLLHDPATRTRLREADIVDCKLDAADDTLLRRFNRPVEGITLERIVQGIKALRSEHPGKIHLQCMFMPVNVKQAEAIASRVREIRPALVQINTPRRPYPKSWTPVTRGNHDGPPPVEYSRLNTISEEQAEEIEAILRATGVPVLSFAKR